MKKLLQAKKRGSAISLAVAVLLVYGSTLFASNKSKMDKWEGFRGLKWGMNIEEINNPNMILVKTSKEKLFTLYTRKTDKLSIGNAKLETIHYFFYKGKLFLIHIYAKGHSNFRSLQGAISAYYEPGYQPNRYVSKWEWYKEYNGGVGMDLEYNVFNGKTTFRIYYYPILKKIKEDKF